MKLLMALCALALVCSTGATGASTPLAAPSGLHAFVYRADEPVKADHTYALMPAFAWNAAQGASSYELQLATSKTFSDATMLYRAKVTAPVASIQKQVPWMTGKPYALWVRARVVSGGRTSGWSRPFGFNTAWQEVPEQRAAPDGLIRWSTVEGATAYEVWFTSVPGGYQTHFTTLTNVADEREFWTLHPQDAGTVHWRVRAMRLVQTGSLPDGIQVVAHGPYSREFTTRTKASISSGRIQPVAAVSNVESTASLARAHQLTPGFAWTGTVDALGHGAGAKLWRVYVFTDKQCVNPVLTGSIVGGPAWAPRDGDPLLLPGTVQATLDAQAGKFPGFGTQTNVFAADGDIPAPAESPAATAGGTGAPAPAAPAAGTSSSTTVAPRFVSLPDNGWPQGRYWWTVVPVTAYEVIADPKKGPALTDSLEYHDLSLPQDLCAAGQVWPFGMQSAPLTTTSSTPYVSGLVAGDRVVSAVSRRPSFRELPVITWQAALGAQTYQVQLSHHLYPWVPTKSLSSVVTSAILPLSRLDIGTWYYRVRGINSNLIGPAKNLAWSKPVAIKISGDRYVVVK
jgi:hypothetical protein